MEKPLAGSNPMLHFQIRTPSTGVRPSTTLFHGLLAVSAICRLIGRRMDRWGRLPSVWGSKRRPVAVVVQSLIAKLPDVWRSLTATDGSSISASIYQWTPAEVGLGGSKSGRSPRVGSEVLCAPAVSSNPPPARRQWRSAVGRCAASAASTWDALARECHPQCIVFRDGRRHLRSDAVGLARRRGDPAGATCPPRRAGGRGSEPHPCRSGIAPVSAATIGDAGSSSA